jgi:NAD+ kinase
MKETIYADFNKDTMFFLYETEHNLGRSPELYSKVKQFLNLTKNKSDAEAVVVIGGDGSLLDVVRDVSLNGLPVLPINGGTVGKNLIDLKPEEIESFIKDYLFQGKCVRLKFPKLVAEIIDDKGNEHLVSAFNDIWVDRQDSLSIRYDLSVIDDDIEGEIGFLSDSPISGDGVLFSTPMGSTGYSRLLSETVLPLHRNTMLVNPMNCMVQKSKRIVHSFGVESDQAIHVTFQDIDFRKNRLAVEGTYLRDSNDNYINVKELKIHLKKKSNNYLEIIARRKKDVIKKQMDFIAR